MDCRGVTIRRWSHQSGAEFQVGVIYYREGQLGDRTRTCDLQRPLIAGCLLDRAGIGGVGHGDIGGQIGLTGGSLR